MKRENLQRLTVSAMMIALSTALSFIPIFEMPMGGSITLFSMVPISMIAIMYDTKWGLCCGALYGFIQMFFGFKNLSYGTWWGAVVAIILFDYIVAFMMLGFSGVFKKVIKNRYVAVIMGITLSCVLRFLCHFITGVTVWREIADTWGAIWYSISYNGTYMLPELIITIAGACILYKTQTINKLIDKIIK